MKRALDLAQESVGVAHPNPRVGAVLVKNDQIIGEGYHVYDHHDHAEIVALKQAGAKARGATLYINLEPCCHKGRTGPCTSALIEAGVKRVVAAIGDPNPKVAGQGFAQLRKAGIQVTTDVEADEARRINEGFARWITTKLPFVTLKAALTLDGKIAARAGQRTQITAKASQAAVQQLRHASDALLTGVGTILVDDPRLTDRTGAPRRRPLLRAVVDSQLRLPLDSELVRSASEDVLVFTTQSTRSTKARALADARVEVQRVPARNGRVDLTEVLRELGRRKMLDVIIEAGAELNGATLAAGIVDKMVLYYAPRIMGTGAVPVAEIPSRKITNAPALSHITTYSLGSDFVVEGYFHDVYGNHRAAGEN